MSDLLLSGAWRKRSACIKCRNLKARCEYASPTDQSCTRCTRSKQECIIPERKRKEGCSKNGSNGVLPSPDSNGTTPLPSELAKNEKSAVYLQQIIQDAQRKLNELNVSPLRCLVVSNKLTWEDAERSYASFKTYPGNASLVKVLGLPGKIVDLDVKWPHLAYAIAIISRLNSANTSLEDYGRLHEVLQSSTIDISIQAYLDRFVAYASVCRFAVPFQGRGVLATMILHGLANVCMTKLEELGWVVLKEFVRWTVTMSVLPLTLFNEFKGMKHIFSFYYSADSMADVERTVSEHIKREGVNMYPHLTLLTSSKPSIALIGIESTAFTDLDAVASIHAARMVVETAFACLQKQEDCLNNINEDLKRTNPDLVMLADTLESEDLLRFPVRSTIFMIRLKIIVRAVVKILDIMYTWTVTDMLPEPECQAILKTYIRQGAEISALFARSFAYLNPDDLIVPTSAFFFASEAVGLMHMLHIATFAGGIDYTLRVDCTATMVRTKWEEMLKISIVARQFYFLLFRVLEIGTIRVGILDPIDDAVKGSGGLDTFNVYCTPPKETTKQIGSLTRQELLALIANRAHDIQHSEFAKPGGNIGDMTLTGVVFEHWSRA